MPERYDVVVIGAGPGGYVAAIRAAQLGMRAACIESGDTLGGTCLNIGCIPSKALLQSSEKFAEAKHGLAEHGIKIGEVGLDLAAMMDRKGKVVTTLTRGIEFLFRKNKVDWLKGHARIAAPGRVALDSGSEVEARAIVIATGSESIPLPGLTVDERQIVSSTGALALDRVPERLAVIGGGYIGLELGSVWARLGSKVTIVEYLDRILPNMDRELGPALQRVLARSGMVFKPATKVAGGTAGNAGVTLELEPAAGGNPRENLAADIVLVAIGRRPFTDGLGLDALGIVRDGAGRIAVNDDFATNIGGIYAIGDVIRGPMLAHKAEEEGVAVVERLAGQKTEVRYDAIPGVVYTWPEAAAVGRTEEELKAAGIDYRAGKFPFSANARARTNADSDGFVKVLADAATDRVLGVHIVGPDAGTMIAEATLAIEFGASAEDLARTCHAHPTLPEALKEAALAVAGRAIHI
jgi:dihydrolipoamide dehydrogenase